MRRIGGAVEVACPTCDRVAHIAVTGFEALVDSLNAFLRAHRHAAEA